MIWHKGWIYGRRGLEIICKDSSSTLGRAAQLFVRWLSTDDRATGCWLLTVGSLWVLQLLLSVLLFREILISIISSRLFEDGQIFTGFKSEGDGSFRFRRLTSSMAPRCTVSSSASPDGTIGHATLTPQGDHSRTQLVLTPQSLNSWGSPLPLWDIIFWAATSSHVLCYPVTL